MATPSSSNAVRQQTEATAAVLDDLGRPTRPGSTLTESDLSTTDIDEHELAPPAYGDVYGEIHHEKDGLGTSARVTDDGRVNIRINQLNRRLSQTFIPALRQQVQSEQDSIPPPAPYIPPSLGGSGDVLPPPRLSVVIQVVGSRGDVQPFIALGKVLKDTYGHRVRLATHPNFKDFVQEHGLEFFSIGGDPSRLMAYMVKNPGLMPGFRSLASGDVRERKKDVAEYIQGCWRSCYKAGNGMGDADDTADSEARPFVADCIIANPPSFAHIHCAEKLGIPLHIMFTMPYSPTQAFPHPLANIQSNTDPLFTNYMSYAMIEILSWQALGDILNRFRAKCLGLDPISLIWAPGVLQRLRVPHTYCWSPALIPKPKDWGPHISISGFFDLASNYSPDPKLQAFLEAGPAPVYIGFGSIVVDDPNSLTELIFEAVRKTGQRVLLSAGWGGIGAGRVPDGVFLLGNVPHDWLFKRVSCVVHHGGAGTTAAGITAGRPTLVVPFFGDQPFWGAMVAQAGAGPEPIPYKQLTAENLANAIDFCLKPASLERARGLASKVAAENGSDVGAQSFHQFLDVDRLRCTLAPTRPAAWRIRRTKIRLSTFAACTLANANLLDFNDLKLYRPREYETDEGPWDPVSGFGAGVFGAFSSMVMGLMDVPGETMKALQIPTSQSRQQSQALRTRTSRSGNSEVSGQWTPPSSRGQSQTSLKLRDSGSQKPSRLSRLTQSRSSTSQSSSEVNRTRSIDSCSGRDSTTSGDQNLLRPIGIDPRKGIGRITKAALQSPMNLSLDITKGFHNAPKLWGDDTIRPHQQVTGLKSGFQAIGKEFGYGMYDGLTGLVTQPWKGAQKEGTTGFLKGLGKGIGGFAVKPGAALFAIPAYFMKGAHKEAQKLYGSNVQSFILASRAAQGYEEWQLSSEKEQSDVIERWGLVQKYLKRKEQNGPSQMVRDVIDAQRGNDSTALEALGGFEGARAAVQSGSGAEPPTRHWDSIDPSTTGAQIPRRPVNSPQASERDRDAPPSGLRSTSRTNTGFEIEDRHLSSSISAEVQPSTHQVSASASQANGTEALTPSESRQQSYSDSNWSSSMDHALNSDEEEEFEQAQRRSGHLAAAETPVIVAGPSSASAASPSQQAPSYTDRSHLGGTNQRDFQAQQQRAGGFGRGEKTAEEKSEEEVVLAHVKKQSLLEAEHRANGRGVGATGQGLWEQEEEEEAVRRAVEMSLRE
ncbi:hypothetical protein LTR62_002154 [Meristemomyces frigidus]|uniref:Glycosyltransferase family 28 N-terminal domain-containing protein n=1 Tax=Meristemomyces frigidus TaxID=1508187 RepID=A0AAN7T7N4_9PEZI|nr:hypothetical protein LTR62_002154 [Meristemomyces frigidus]